MISKDTQREIWLDWTRVIACFMVMIVHSTEPFYLGGDGALILTKAEAYWAAFFDSIVRSCVPLFVVMSSYLQFPLRYTTAQFFRRRAVRVIIPFLIWTVIYALVWGEPVQNFKDLLLNFNYSAGHLWYVYMLLGLYLLMPLLSPWAERVGKKELKFYLAIWIFTTIIPLVRDWTGGEPDVVCGVSGLPRQALWPLWGEASWNSYGLFYYFSGFIGYMLLGLYIRKFVDVLSWKKTLLISVPCFAGGFAVSFIGFIRRAFIISNGEFPISDVLQKAVWLETTWCNDTIGVALMTIGSILLLRKISRGGKIYTAVIQPISKASYGMYLSHLLVLATVCGFVREYFGVGVDASLGVWTAFVEIMLSAIVSFVIVAILSILIQRIPKIGKFVIG